MLGRLDAADAPLAEALALARASGDPSVTGRVLRLLGLLRKRQRRLAEGVAALEEAIALLGDDGDGVSARTNLGEIRLVQEDAAAAERLAREALDHARPDSEGAMLACAKMASVLLWDDRPDEAAPWVERAIATAIRLADVTQLPSLRGIQGQVALLQGRHDDARAALVAYLGWAERRNKWDAVVGIRLNLAHVAMESDDAAGLAEHLDAIDRLRIPAAHIHAPVARLLRVVERAQRGDHDGAHEILGQWSSTDRGRVSASLLDAVRARLTRRGLGEIADALTAE
jgi:tetratricopeptide (TPR) repeat protein